jgi:concanavalin A-like lectin/glucanase superfamily protein/beta-propeller uncharacterized protein DUF5122
MVDVSSAGAGRGRRVLIAGLASLTLLVPLLSVGFPSASADTAPEPPVSTATVSADSLPTVQIGPGVVWDQVIVGNTVYVTGEFTTARPAGAAVGSSSEVARSNVLAYNLTTGVLSTTWAPTLNGTGRAIEASADGRTIYIGGSFTSVNGVARNRIVALNATTGAVVTAFNANPNARVSAIAVTDSTLYLGGTFTVVGGQPREHLAAVSAANGAVQSWAPSADAAVLALTAPPGRDEVVVGGHFRNLNATAAGGLGAISTVTGETIPFAINSTISNGGEDAGITSLRSDADTVYGSGYTFGPGNFEGTFAATAEGGEEIFITSCRGDTYDVTPANGALYLVGHNHDCSALDGLPQSQPWTFQHTMAHTATPGAGGATNQTGNFAGHPAPELLHWHPAFATGTYTGQVQAGWTIESNDRYVVAGGEFPTVNGAPQQGLSRFAIADIAPNAQGPRDGGAALAPTVISQRPGEVRVSWKSSWDRDNRNLRYEVLRGATLSTSVVVSTQTMDSAWFRRPIMSFRDTGVAAGSTQTYRIRVRDAFNHILIGNPTTYQVPAVGDPALYAATVVADGATDLWRLGEPDGTKAYDFAGVDDLTLDPTAVRGADGAMLNDATTTATTFDGTAVVPAVAQNPIKGPDSFTTEGWFRTTSRTGGQLIGLGNSRTEDSGLRDRTVYLTTAGRIVFGVGSGSAGVTSPRSYNDGQWHHFAASLGSAGMNLYVDGVAVGRRASVTTGLRFTGYWRIGGDDLGSFPSRPGNPRFVGSIEDVAVYPAPLSPEQVQAHFEASGRCPGC